MAKRRYYVDLNPAFGLFGEGRYRLFYRNCLGQPVACDERFDMMDNANQAAHLKNVVDRAGN